jgi:hypothetical protein
VSLSLGQIFRCRFAPYPRFDRRGLQNLKQADVLTSGEERVLLVLMSMLGMNAELFSVSDACVRESGSRMTT